MALRYRDDRPFIYLSECDGSTFEDESDGSDSPDFNSVEETLLQESDAVNNALSDLYRNPTPRSITLGEHDTPSDWSLEVERLEERAAELEESLFDLSDRREDYLYLQFKIRRARAMAIRVKKEKAGLDADDDESVIPPIAVATPRPTSLQEAWARKDYEAVVRFASDLVECLSGAPALYDLDGVRQLCAALRYRFKAFQAMSLNGLAVADANRLLELLAEFGDVDVEVDESLLPVTASTESTLEPSSERRSARLVAQQGQKRTATDQLGGQLVKRKKGGNRRLVRRSARIIQLPVELIVMVAEHLSTVDRISLANTRHEWRNIPQLWQSLEFVRVKETSKRGWHRDTIDACISAIETCQRRSHGTLTHVVLQGFLTSRTVGPILDVLRASSATLKHLAIPTLDQGQCFEQLYQRCPNLVGIDVRVHTDPNEVSSVQSEHLSRSTSLFSQTKLPFKLKTFVGSLDIDCGDIAPHLEGIEVVRGLKFQRQKQLNFIDGIVRAAPTLVEWRDDLDDKWDTTTVTLGDYGVGQEQLPKEPIVFPKLRKLSGLWSEHFIDCEFPALTEARLNSLRGPSSLSPASQNDRLRIATVIRKSPLLKKLDILLPSGYEALKQIFQAVSQLEHLEDLGLWSSGTISLQALVNVQKASSEEDSTAEVVCPALHTLRLHTRAVSVRFERELERELSELMLLRFYLTRGCKLKEAETRTQAALVAYEKAGYGLTKAQKKKIVAASAADAAGSSYKGTYTTVDKTQRETFSVVLSKLFLSRNMKQNLLEGNQSLLNQLIFQTAEIDTSKHFERLSGGARYY